MTWSCAPACTHIIHLSAATMVSLLALYPRPACNEHCHWVATPEMVRHAEAAALPAPGPVPAAYTPFGDALPGGLIGGPVSGTGPVFGSADFGSGLSGGADDVGTTQRADVAAPATVGTDVPPDMDVPLSLTRIPAQAVPEPASWVGLGFAVLGLLLVRRRSA